jgi:predicted RNA binding protein YcfA (HicA-like mRNA interferase family)
VDVGSGLMGQLQKLYEKIKNNPKAVRFEELDKILIRAGFEKRQPKGGSSHYTYIKNENIVTVPFKQPQIKRIYVEKVLEALGDYFED